MSGNAFYFEKRFKPMPPKFKHWTTSAPTYCINNNGALHTNIFQYQVHYYVSLVRKLLYFQKYILLVVFSCISSDLEYSYASKLYELMDDIWMCIQMETMKCHWKQRVEPRSAISGTHMHIDKKSLATNLQPNC